MPIPSFGICVALILHEMIEIVMDNRIDTIRQIQELVNFTPTALNEILWTKESGYDDNFWFQFTFKGKPYALFLKGEEFCANIDYTLILCDSVDEWYECPVGKQHIIHEFDHHDTTKAKIWAEAWLLKFLKNISKR